MKIAIEAPPLPDGALLARYRDMPGAYTDCFTVSIGRAVSAEAFIEAFYTTALFKCERLVLMLIGRGCSGADVRALAAGKVDAFAAWTVEGRTERQLMVRDFLGMTRSWLMVGAPAGGLDGSQLHFGTAALPGERDKAGNPRPGAGFRLLLPVHAFYAKALLRAAAARLSRPSRLAHAP